MKKQINILLILTGHSLDSVRQQFGNFDAHFFAITKAQHTVYAICDKWPNQALSDITQFDGIIFSGSAAMCDENKPWMQAATKIILSALEKEIPLLCICFGHQLLGQACQALVGPNPKGRALGSRKITVVKNNDTLLQDQPTEFWAQTSHRDVILNKSPYFEVLATAPHDPFHVIKAGSKAWGVQFHPEWNTSIMKSYLEARRYAFDKEWGEQATEKQLLNIQNSDEASRILLRFVDICRKEHTLYEKEK
jgi:GMP synthase (glutamine-hydrolysing)